MGYVHVELHVMVVPGIGHLVQHHVRPVRVYPVRPDALGAEVIQGVQDRAVIGSSLAVRQPRFAPGVGVCVGQGGERRQIVRGDAVPVIGSAAPGRD